MTTKERWNRLKESVIVEAEKVVGYQTSPAPRKPCLHGDDTGDERKKEMKTSKHGRGEEGI